MLDGSGFAMIKDTDAGAYDGDTAHDRAVGPMQFIPSTWARWGATPAATARATQQRLRRDPRRRQLSVRGRP
ncbi:hypothetical protein NKH77_13590 [Streptomyces sp. M19]